MNKKRTMHDEETKRECWAQAQQRKTIPPQTAPGHRTPRYENRGRKTHKERTDTKKRKNKIQNRKRKRRGKSKWDSANQGAGS